jgi:hypothetical protein
MIKIHRGTAAFLLSSAGSLGIFASCVGPIANLMNGRPFGWRVPLITLACSIAVLVWGGLWSRAFWLQVMYASVMALVGAIIIAGGSSLIGRLMAGRHTLISSGGAINLAATVAGFALWWVTSRYFDRAVAKLKEEDSARVA